MRYYPLFMDIAKKACLVVGGGGVGTRKALGLLGAGARVTVVSPAVSPGLAEAARENEDLTLKARSFAPSDLDGMSLVFAATDSRELNRKIRKGAEAAGLLCNIAAGEDKGDFILPAVVEQGDLLIAVSTCGASPALARRIKEDLTREYGPEYGLLAQLLAGIRKRLLLLGHDPEGHREKFTALVEADLAGLIAGEDFSKIDKILEAVLGEGFSWASLTTKES